MKVLYSGITENKCWKVESGMRTVTRIMKSNDMSDSICISVKAGLLWLKKKEKKNIHKAKFYELTRPYLIPGM